MTSTVADREARQVRWQELRALETQAYVTYAEAVHELNDASEALAEFGEIPGTFDGFNETAEAALAALTAAAQQLLQHRRAIAELAIEGQQARAA